MPVNSDFLIDTWNTALFHESVFDLDRKFVSVTAGNTEYDPETAWNMELGTRFNHGPPRAQASVYCMNVSGQQLTVFPPGMSTGRMMTNAGRSRSIGIKCSNTHLPQKEHRKP